jgi:hypothetical protein
VVEFQRTTRCYFPENITLHYKIGEKNSILSSVSSTVLELNFERSLKISKKYAFCIPIIKISLVFLPSLSYNMFLTELNFNGTGEKVKWSLCLTD